MFSADSRYDTMALRGPSKKKKKMMFLLYKKRGRRAGFCCYLLFPSAFFLYTLLPSPRDTLEFLGQILINRNIRY